MKNTKVGLLLVGTLFLVTVVSAQKSIRAYELPSEYASIIIVSDPGCPIRLSDPQLLQYETGERRRVYTVTNASGANVESFQVKELSWLGGQESTKTSTVSRTDAFLPNESFSTAQSDVPFEIQPLKEKLFKDHSRPKDIWIIVVTKVATSDGRNYDVRSKYERLERFVNGLADTFDVPPGEIREKEDKLTKYIIDIFGSQVLLVRSN